jgi:ATP-dependent Clp protease ATP-binding subunit ClpC
MFDSFTDQARKVLAVADQEAERWNREAIDTEHLLLSLIKKSVGQSESTAVAILVRLQVDLCRLRKEVEKRTKRGPAEMRLGRLPQTPVAKRVITEAMEEARSCNHSHVGTEHLLLGLLKVPEGVAWEALTACGLTLEQARQEVAEPTIQ